MACHWQHTRCVSAGLAWASNVHGANWQHQATISKEKLKLDQPDSWLWLCKCSRPIMYMVLEMKKNFSFAERKLAHTLLQPCVHHSVTDQTHLHLSHSFCFLFCIMCSCENGWEKRWWWWWDYDLTAVAGVSVGPLENCAHVNFTILSSSRLV